MSNSDGELEEFQSRIQPQGNGTNTGRWIYIAKHTDKMEWLYELC